MESSTGVQSSCSFCSSRDAYDFDCNICYELPKEPIVTLCGHLFCRPCLSRWLGIHSRYTHIKKCPTCMAPITENTLIPLYGKGMKTSTPSTFKENRFVQHIFVTIRAFMALMSVTLLTSWLLRPVHLLQNKILATTRDVRNYVQCLLEPVHNFQNKIFASTFKVDGCLYLLLLPPIHLLQNEISATTQDVIYFVHCLSEQVHDFRNKIFASTLEVNRFPQCLFHDLKNQVCGLPLEGKLFVRCLMELIHDLPKKVFTNRTVLDSPLGCCEQVGLLDEQIL